MVEFNNGFVTALALYYAHSMDDNLLDNKSVNASLVNYAASDHLYDIEIPESISSELRDRIQNFVDYVFSQRLERPSRQEVFKMFEDSRGLLMDIDKEVFGLKVEVIHG
jgi:hypothetical protein